MGAEDIDLDIGKESEQWAPLDTHKQKPLSWSIWDPSRQLYAKGAHYPVQVFIGAKNKTRRSAEGWKHKQEMSDKRSRNIQRIQKIRESSQKKTNEASNTTHGHGDRCLAAQQESQQQGGEWWKDQAWSQDWIRPRYRKYTYYDTKTGEQQVTCEDYMPGLWWGQYQTYGHDPYY